MLQTLLLLSALISTVSLAEDLDLYVGRLIRCLPTSPLRLPHQGGQISSIDLHFARGSRTNEQDRYSMGNAATAKADFYYSGSATLQFQNPGPRGQPNQNRQPMVAATVRAKHGQPFPYFTNQTIDHDASYRKGSDGEYTTIYGKRGVSVALEYYALAAHARQVSDDWLGHRLFRRLDRLADTVPGQAVQARKRPC